MIVRMGLLTRKPGIATEQFRRHWREVHGPLAARMPSLRRYHQNHVVASPLGGGCSPESCRLDGISELWFEDLASMRAAVASDAYRAVVADEPNCMVGTKVIVAEQNRVLALPSDRATGPLIKCMSVLTRVAGVQPTALRQAWRDEHAALVARLPGLAGYTQNVVLERAAGGREADFETVPVDGMAELWFRDIEALRVAFASDAARQAESHARGFARTTATWLVEVHAVL